MTVIDHAPKPALPSAAEREMARAAQRSIMAALDHSKAAEIILISDDGSQPSIALPPSALKLIGQLLGAMSQGGPVVLMPQKQELTTLEAANFLNVSRPFVIKEIERGHLRCRRVGSHRRIAFDDLIAYAEGLKQRRDDALERMADDARELGLEY